MPHITSSVTELPASCRSAAERMSAFLESEDRYAALSEHARRKLTSLEKELSRETGTPVALVAYRLS